MVGRLLRLVERFGPRRAAAALSLLAFVVLVVVAGMLGRALALTELSLEAQVVAFAGLALVIFGIKIFLAMELVDSLLVTKRRLEIEVGRRDQAERRLQEMSFRDELTGLPNRRFFIETGARLVAQARRHGRPVAVVMIDLDGFKRINDVMGHLEGDRVLRRTAQRLAAEIRAADVVARLGGDEFVVLLPDTDKTGALYAAERLRLAVRGQPKLKGVTISVGVAASQGQAADLESLIARADAALLTAKRLGRDQVVVDEPLDPTTAIDETGGVSAGH